MDVTGCLVFATRSRTYGVWRGLLNEGISWHPSMLNNSYNASNVEAPLMGGGGDDHCSRLLFQSLALDFTG